MQLRYINLETNEEIKYEHSGSDYSSISNKEYYTNDNIIYSIEESSGNSNLYVAGWMGIENNNTTTKIYYFKDGTNRVFR
jgi:hypothetical protein